VTLLKNGHFHRKDAKSAKILKEAINNINPSERFLEYSLPEILISWRPLRLCGESLVFSGQSLV